MALRFTLLVLLGAAIASSACGGQPIAAGSANAAPPSATAVQARPTTQPRPPATATPTRRPDPTAASTGAMTRSTAPASQGNAPRYDPSGPDVDCSDFARQAEAQRFFEAPRQATGERDRHRLDADGDGIACESLL